MTDKLALRTTVLLNHTPFVPLTSVLLCCITNSYTSVREGRYWFLKWTRPEMRLNGWANEFWFILSAWDLLLAGAIWISFPLNIDFAGLIKTEKRLGGQPLAWQPDLYFRETYSHILASLFWREFLNNFRFAWSDNYCMYK